MIVPTTNEQSDKCNTSSAAPTLRVMRCGVALVCAGLVAACTPEAPPADVEIGFRNPTVTLAGTTRFDVARFAGSWLTLSCIGTCSTQEAYSVATDGVFLREVAEVSTAYLEAGPGILREMGGDSTLVVMWVDDGFRTAAIGDADGRWAAILDRGNARSDRADAAREILDFNGWDVSQMQDVK